jgi:hypothetical protein
MQNRLLISAFAILFSACATTSPCEEFVEAQCECATADECDEYRKAYENPTPDDDDECSAGLAEAQDNAESCDTAGSAG